MKKIVFIIHGKIKQREKLIADIKQCFGNSAHLIFAVTEYADNAVELSYKAFKEGATHIICIGGDGSLNEVINGAMKAGHELDLKNTLPVQVGLLPHGTGNDFAKTMGVGFDVEQLKQWIREDSYRVIDLGSAVYTGIYQQPAKRYFINISDVGIGGAIAQDLSNSSKILGSFLTYQKGIFKALLTYKNQPVKVTADTFSYEKKIMSLIVANGKYFGGGMGIAPHALPDDKLLSVVIIGEISTWAYIKNMGNIRKSKKIVHPELQYLHASEIYIESPAGPLPIDMDGEFIGFSPVTMKIVPAAIKFIGPK